MFHALVLNQENKEQAFKQIGRRDLFTIKNICLDETAEVEGARIAAYVETDVLEEAR